MRPAVIFLLCLAPSLAIGQAEQWTTIARSQSVDFSIRCYRGHDLIWGIYPRNDTSEWQVARNISVLHGVDGKTEWRFVRGFVAASKDDVYVAASDVSCEATER